MVLHHRTSDSGFGGKFQGSAIIALKMTTTNWLSIAQILVTLVGLYVGPKLAIRYSLKQFRTQKWLEGQQEVYTILLEDLSRVYSYSVNVMDEIEQGIEHKPRPEIDAGFGRARHRIEQYSITGAYRISDVAAEALRLYQRKSNRSDSVEDFHESYDQLSDAAKECLEVIRSEAKKALT